MVRALPAYSEHLHPQQHQKSIQKIVSIDLSLIQQTPSKIIGNVIQLFDHAVDMTDPPEQLQDSDEDDELKAGHTAIPLCTNPDTTIILNQSMKSFCNNDQSTRDSYTKRHTGGVRKKLNVVKNFKKFKNISQVS